MAAFSISSRRGSIKTSLRNAGDGPPRAERHKARLSVRCWRISILTPARRTDGRAGLGDGSVRRRLRRVSCNSEEKAQEALALIQAFVNENGLTLHPNKTHIGDCRIKGQGFEFLGYHFEAGHRFVRKKSCLTPSRQGQGQDQTDERPKPRPHDRGAQSHAQGLVWLLQARDLRSQGRRRLCAPAAAGDVAQARQTTRLRRCPGGPATLAQCFLRFRRAVHPRHSLAAGETVPMRTPPTGEPYAGKPPVRFGGRGGESLPYPYQENGERPTFPWIATSPKPV
jgi:hypothetical protein